MKEICILDRGSGAAGRQIVRCIGNIMQKRGEAVVIILSDKYMYLRESAPALLIVTPEAFSAMPEQNEGIFSHTVLLPGETSGYANFEIGAEYAISYGLSPRDTITASSINSGSVVLSLQRELVTLEGIVLERQELPKVDLNGLTVEESMVVCGTLLLFGVAPEDLII